MKIKNVLLNFLGSALLAFGVCAFIVPSNIIAGGATGISIVLHKIFGLDISLITLIINLTCLPIGYVLGSKELAYGSILSSLFYPMALAVFERMPQLSNLSDSVLLSVIYAGAVCGVGIGLVIKSGGSTGGTDIPCLLIHKYFHIPVDTVINVTDTIIMLSQIPFSNVTNVLYGIVYTFIMTTSISKVLTFGVDKYRVTVVSEQHEEIRRLLLENDYGLTMIYAQSGYTYTEIQKLETVIPINRLQQVQKLIESIDNAAFITIEKVTDVKGRGFTLEREWLQM